VWLVGCQVKTPAMVLLTGESLEALRFATGRAMLLADILRSFRVALLKGI
jgi:hypothetical protein